MITKENLKRAVHSYVDEVFAGFEKNTMNMIKKIGAKLVIENKFDMVDMLLTEDKMLDVSKLREFAIPEIETVGKIEVAGIRFGKEDFENLFAKIQAYDNQQ